LSLHLQRGREMLLGLTYKYKWNDQILWMVNFSWMNFFGILKGR
jgi:hypothetical protein